MNEPLNNEATLDQTSNETAVVEEKKVQEPEFSNRDALAKAIAEKREVRPGQEPEAREARRPSPTEPSRQQVKDAVSDNPEPPAEFSAAGKKAWLDKDINGIQKEFRRIHDSRTQEINRAQRAEREALEKSRTWSTLGDKAAPYIAARGKEGTTPEQAIMEALGLVDALRSEKPEAVKAELKRLGIDLDAAPGNTTKAEDEKIGALLETVNHLVEKDRQQEFSRVASVFNNSISTLAAQKTRTGEPVFPGFHDNSETGREFAKELGSLTKEPFFVNMVLRRFPDADHTTLVREAYIWLGGKVSGEAVTVSPEKAQEHIKKTTRAASATPGRVVARNESSNLVGKLGNRAALARAIAEHRGE